MKQYSSTMILLTSIAVLAFGIIELFELRFESGDVYPAYSSLRSDPLGTMAFYESLDGMAGFSVRRDFSTANRLPDGRETTYFHLAGSMEVWRRAPEATLKEIEQFVIEGGRLVITMFPQPVSLDSSRPRNRVRENEETSFQDRWGVNFRIINLDRTPDGVYEPDLVLNESGLPLPELLDWHSGIVFTSLNDAWKRIYARGDDAVVIERKFGRGTVVIATDSYFLSNEAMLRDREPGLLAWLIGPGRNVIFDEAHLGVTEAPGVATLMRKYHMQWFLAGLILLAGLFIWMNSASLVPLRTERAAQDYIAGKDAAAGFDNLLRRSIPKRDLLATCFGEWKKSVAQTGKYSTDRIRQAEAAFQAENSRPERNRDPVEAYQTISGILRTKRNAE
ncbi:MAG TPA: DUF4350 domain-containing protein [Terriglobia bacterium]|nr:DUF4350 domain-containing protein [Terriglobia bacterium]